MTGFQSGERVRIKTDPGRVGVLTPRTSVRGGLTYVQVLFPEGARYIPEDQIEPVAEGSDDPVELLARGRLCGVSDLRRTLTHARLTGRIADVIYSMDMTGADFYAYQFKPLMKLLNSATTGMLIADEVGLGKTIEAGLIWTELRARADFQRLLVVCPSVLKEKWRRELRQRFGLNADIVDAGGLLDRIQRVIEEPDPQPFALIASLQGIRPPKGWQDEEPARNAPPRLRLAQVLDESREARTLFDLTVVDEGHYMRNPETASAAAGKLLRGVSEYFILLSATPVHLKSHDLFQLLNLADEDTFTRPDDFDALLAANRPLVRARDMLIAGRGTAEGLRDELLAASANPLLAGSQQIAALLEAVPESGDLREPRFITELAYRLECVNLLGHVVTRTRKREVKEWKVIREAIPEEVPLSEVERGFYERVTEVVRDYCERSFAHAGFLLVMPQRQMSSSMPAALRAWKQRWKPGTNQMYEDLGQDDRREPDEAEPGPLVQELIERAATLGDERLLRDNDSKYSRLRDRLKEFFGAYPRERAVVFSYFRPTLEYLRERLREDGIPTITLHGGTEDKDDALSLFQESPGGTVLLSSEVGSEGVDLQFCWVVINYDLPWNPMRVEQRIGRLDRLGQNSPRVVIWNLFYADTIDSRIYHRLYQRLRIFEETLGGLEPILGEKLRELTIDLLSARLTPDQESARIEQTRIAVENVKQQEERLEQEAAHLVAYGDYIVNQVNAAREMSRRIDGKDLQRYVLEFYQQRYPGCEFRQVDEGPEFEVTLSSDAGYDLERFIRSRRASATTRLATPGASRVRCRFENSVIGKGGRSVEIINQFHPLVRFISSALGSRQEQIRPAVAITLARTLWPGEVPPGRYVFSVQRWSMRGLQDLEYLHFAAASLDPPHLSVSTEDAERLVMLASSSGLTWLTASSRVDLAGALRVVENCCLAGSEAAYRKRVREQQAVNDDRIQLQERTLERHLRIQREQFEAIRDRHRARGRIGLVAATEGRIRALEERVARRRREIQLRRGFTHDNHEVCVGVIEMSEHMGSWEGTA
jgi:superfamily II DNA or RNA helicase